VCLKDRLARHIYSINKRDDASALSSHIKQFHNDILPRPDISSFRLAVLQAYKDPLDILIGESLWVEKNHPTLNRQHELRACKLGYR